MQALFPDVIVNGETIPAAQVAAETQNHDGPKGKPGIAWRKAANAVAIRTLLLQEAARRSIAGIRCPGAWDNLTPPSRAGWRPLINPVRLATQVDPDE